MTKQLHPITGLHDEAEADFRPKSAMQKEYERQRSAFGPGTPESEVDTNVPIPELANKEPETAFELEMSGGRKLPLDVPESANPSPPALTEEERKAQELEEVARMERERLSQQQESDKAVSVEKEKKPTQPQPAAPKPTS